LSKTRRAWNCRFFVSHKVSLDEFATPLLYILPMYIFVYEMAFQRGYDPTARRYDIVPQKVRYQGEGEEANCMRARAGQALRPALLWRLIIINVSNHKKLLQIAKYLKLRK
jgi:hypothetical protein